MRNDSEFESRVPLKKKTLNVPFAFQGFFNLILLGAFLAFSSLGAGSGKQTRKTLGAHQERMLITIIKENTALSIVQTELRTVYIVSCVGKYNIN